MKSAIPRRVIAGFCAGFVALALAAFLPYEQVKRHKLNDEWVVQAQTTLTAMAQLSGAINAAQSAQRGFLLTHASPYRETFEINRRLISDTFLELESQLASDPQQSLRTARVRTLLEDHLTGLEASLANAPQANSASGVADRGDPLPASDEREMRQLKRNLDDIMQIQRAQLERRMADVEDGSRYYQLSYFLLIGLIVVVFARVYWFIRRTFIIRAAQARRMEKQRNLLDSIINSMADGLFVSDLDGKGILTNRTFERQIFREPEENWSQAWTRHYRLFDMEGRAIDHLELPSARVLAGESNASREFLVRSLTTSEEHYLRVVATPYLGPGGELQGAVCIIHDISENKRAEHNIRDVHKRVVRSLGELALRNKEISALNSASQKLQACDGEAQTYQVLMESLAELLPYCSGAIYLRRMSDDNFQLIRHWGRERKLHPQFAAADCWGLKRGVTHPGHRHVHGSDDNMEPGWGLACLHDQETTEAIPTLCAPITAQGEVLGLLYIQDTSGPEEGKLQPDSCSIVTTLADHAGLAISGLRLRESLRLQSIQDPLTGLFNRRYLEASLNRELANAERQQQPLAVLMVDVDHFKKVNDHYGHDTGDAALSEIARVLGANLRSGDMACRFGGEEFAVLLPRANAESAAQCADRILQAVRGIDLQVGQLRLDELSVSIGVALYPLHATTAAGLVKAADLALYQAKHQGRDQMASAAN